MSIFNSLGSNYSTSFMWRNLFATPSKNSKKALCQVLGEYYGGQATLTFKGREALELGLKNSQLPPGSQVGISGFTCYVVCQAVANAGYTPVFIDNAPGHIQYGLDELKEIHEKNKLGAIIVQNTLGLPADMESLASFCRTNNILIVEDLAHSAGAVYSNGVEAGKVGDFAMLSFSQDKPMDAVAGGALITKQQLAFSAPKVSLWQRFELRKYPVLTAMIRSTYNLGLGRVLHHIFKKLHVLATPMNDRITGLHAMSSATAKMVLGNWQDKEDEISHRRQIADIYKQKLSKNLQLAEFGQPTYLRFPIVVKDRDALISFLKKFGLYFGDTWYDAPIAPKHYLSRTNYQKGSCPNAEKLAATIVNLPTHRHVTVDDAKQICERIEQWQALPQ